MRKKVPITYSKERVVLSDVLPYETPLIFSNRYFYSYLLKREKSLVNSKFKSEHNKAFSEIEKLLFRKEITRPFIFNINHKVNDYRQLNVIHPNNQLKVVEFYDKYKYLILYYSSLSPYSIRRPASIAKFTFYNDLLHKKNSDGDLEHSQIEQDESEYENLKSFFTYRKYSNIHKFFESYQFHRCEKKYNKLLKVDITKCFDSIYTHTIAWAIFNKNIVKDNVAHSLRTFPGEFDVLMQKLNANETNGIVIGPEFSRIFAEIILQQIDKDLHERLRVEDGAHLPLIHKVDYEIFRYVDDYFIFYNKDIDELRILRELKFSLNKFKMYINQSKCVSYYKPIITEISLAKQKITDLFNDHLIMKSRENTTDDKNNIMYFSSNNVITRFKSVVKETGVDYKDIMNYSLAVLDKKTLKLINTYIKEIKNDDKPIEKEYENGMLEILDVAFFLYSVSPRVNSTIKLCLLIDKILCFLKKNKTNDYVEPFTTNNKHNILKKISDEIFLILRKNKSEHETQIETLYLLIALSQMGREYRLNLKLLCSYFNIKVHSNNEIELTNDLNYFSLTVLLFYIKDIAAFKDLKEKIKVYIYQKFEKIIVDKNWSNNSEMVMLLLDTLTCPYLDNEVSKHLKNKIKNASSERSKKRYLSDAKQIKFKFKKELLSLVGINENQISLIEQEKFWFIKWTDFDFRLELQSKRSQEVY